MTNSIGAYGIVQWLDGRRENLNAFAKARGTKDNDLDTQIDFIDHELKGSENYALQELLKTDNIEDATYAVRKFYERPGEHEANDANRLRQARKVLENNKDVEETPTEIFSDSTEEGLRRGLNKWSGKTMDLHGVGCVEAAEKIGKEYSEFLKKEYDKGIRYIPYLIEDAIKEGIEVTDFDESKLSIGDLVTWKNPGSSNNHVGVFIGNRDGVPYVADNSSGKDKVLERPLYRDWQEVESIIKTGGNSKNFSDFSVSIDDENYDYEDEYKNFSDEKFLSNQPVYVGGDFSKIETLLQNGFSQITESINAVGETAKNIFEKMSEVSFSIPTLNSNSTEKNVSSIVNPFFENISGTAENLFKEIPTVSSVFGKFPSSFFGDKTSTVEKLTEKFSDITPKFEEFFNHVDPAVVNSIISGVSPTNEQTNNNNNIRVEVGGVTVTINGADKNPKEIGNEVVDNLKNIFNIADKINKAKNLTGTFLNI